MEIDESAPGNKSQQRETRTHPEAGRNGHVDDPDTDPQMNEQDEDEREQRGLPASDPESGA
jgi:hypothetical protein